MPSILYQRSQTNQTLTNNIVRNETKELQLTRGPK